MPIQKGSMRINIIFNTSMKKTIEKDKLCKQLILKDFLKEN